MKRLFSLATIVLALLAQSACGAPPAATQASKAVPPTATSSPTPPPPPTATATLALPVVAGTALPRPAETLSKANIGGIIEVARWGSGQVRKAAYSPDGQSIAIATALGVSIYQADTLTRKVSFETESPVYALAFSPDGAILATGLLHDSVTTWNAVDGTLLKTYQGQKEVTTDQEEGWDFISAVAFSEDGSLLAAGSNGAFVTVWKVADGSVVQAFKKHVLGVTRVFFSLDGKAVFSASYDGTVRLTQLSDGQLLRAYGGQAVRDAAISKDGKILATDDLDLYGSPGNVLLWDIESGRKLQTIKAGDYMAHVQSVAFSPDGQSIATAWSDYSVKVWSVSDGSLLGALDDLKPETQLPKDWSYVVYPVVSFSPDGKNLMWAGDDSVAFLDPAGTTLLKKQVLVTPAIFSIALSPDGQTLASSEGQGVRLRHFADGSLYADQPEIKAFGSVAFAPDGNSIAVGFLDSASEHSALLLWPVTPQGVKKSFDTSLAFAESRAAFLPDGKSVAVGVSREILIYNLSDGALISTIHSGLGRDYEDMEFSADGKLLAVSGGNTMRLLRVEDGQSLKSYNAGWALAFSPDSTLLAGADSDKNVQVWKVPTDQVVVTLSDIPDYVSSLQFSNDGTLLAAGLVDGTIIVWSMPDGAVLKTWQAHAAGVSGLIFSPEGKLLISSSYDGTIRVWGLKP